MTKINGPYPTECGTAYQVAASAERLLDAYLEKRVTAELVKALAINLRDLQELAIGDNESFDTRANELIDTVFSPDDTEIKWMGDGEPVIVRTLKCD